MGRLAGELDSLVLVGREAPAASRARYAVGAGVELVSLPYYRRLTEPAAVLRSSVQSLARFWRALRGVDGVWLLGPHPLAIAFAALAAMRRKRVVLGVRQDTRAYVQSRHPGRRSLRVAAAVLDAAWRGLARRFPVVVVGHEIAAQYARAGPCWRSPFPSSPSATWFPRRWRWALVRGGAPGDQRRPAGDGEESAAARGRAGAAREDGDRWRLVVCGEGAMQPLLEDRLRELGVADRAELRGYVPYGPKLLDLYRQSHVLLHVSWTEGVPQVLVEAFAAGLPVVATDVGGVATAVGRRHA